MKMTQLIVNVITALCTTGYLLFGIYLNNTVNEKTAVMWMLGVPLTILLFDKFRQRAKEEEDDE